MSKRLIYAEDVTNALRNYVRGGHIILSYEYIKDIVLSLPSAQPLTEEDYIELRDRFGDEVEAVVRDMVSGEGKRWVSD